MPEVNENKQNVLESVDSAIITVADKISSNSQLKGGYADIINALANLISARAAIETMRRQ